MQSRKLQAESILYLHLPYWIAARLFALVLTDVVENSWGWGGGVSLIHSKLTF